MTLHQIGYLQAFEKKLEEAITIAEAQDFSALVERLNQALVEVRRQLEKLLSDQAAVP